MELKFSDKDKSEIFGAKDNSERRVNLRNFSRLLRRFLSDLGRNIQKCYDKT